MKTVTAVRAAGGERVVVELDGQPWRTLPLEAVVRARLVAGVPLDRARARDLARELRRLAALRAATAALRRRGRSTAELRARLSERGVRQSERERTLDVLERAGLVDDDRFACERARALAERGSGNALIRHDLERRGVAVSAIEAALGRLEPELERARAIIVRRGDGARTARYLAARGFDGDAVALAVAREDEVTLG